MLMPKRVKRRKQFRGSMAGKALRGNKITMGEFGIVATEPCWIKSNQIEAARIAMTRYMKRGGKVWIKIFPDISDKELKTRKWIFTTILPKVRLIIIYGQLRRTNSVILSRL